LLVGVGIACFLGLSDVQLGQPELCLDVAGRHVQHRPILPLGSVQVSALAVRLGEVRPRGDAVGVVVESLPEGQHRSPEALLAHVDDTESTVHLVTSDRHVDQ